MVGEGGITLPGAGHVSKKELMIFGGLAVIVVGVALYRHHTAQTAATAAASTTSAVDPNFDLATGFDYGTPQDNAALAYTGGSYGGGGAYYGSGMPTNTTSVITSNAQWAQAVEDYLVNTSGAEADATTVAAALGKYLTGQPMTADQVSIAEQGVAFEGQPPQSGPDGYPPSFRTASAPPPAQGGSSVPKPGSEVDAPWLVQNGQSIASVAARFGISTSHIQQYNPGKAWTPGQTMIIPYEVRAGDTVQKIADLYEIGAAHITPYITFQ